MFVIPVGSTSELSRRPWVTLFVMAACIGLFAVISLEVPPRVEVGVESLEIELDEKPWLLGTDHAPPPELSVAEVAEQRRAFEARVTRVVDGAGGLERRLSLVPARGLAQVGWVTNLFVHFGLLHLIGNLLFLWIVGPLLEEAWGRFRFGLFYLLAGVGASAAQVLLSPHSVVSIGGASGAIAGCMGAFAVRFAASKIRFFWFFWLIRPFWGSFHLPAWTAGLFWFGRELFDLKDGGATGVATGAHVGGFVLGSAVALGMKALGWERAFKTVSETTEEHQAQASRLSRASEAIRMGDFGGAQSELQALLGENPDYEGAPMLLAEAEVRGRKSAARLEKLLRPQLTRADSNVEATLTRLWDDLETLVLTDAFLWALVERLRARKDLRHDRLLESALRRLSNGTGRHAIAARQVLADRAASSRAIELDANLTQPSEDQEIDLPATDSPRPELTGPVNTAPVVLPATLHAVTADRVSLVVEGRVREVPFSALKRVEAAVVPRGGRNELFVDLVLATKASMAPAALRLSGADPAVPALFRDRAPPQAWEAFVRGLRRQLSPADARPAWTTLESLEALTASWS